MVLKKAWSYNCSAFTDFWCSTWLPAVLLFSGESPLLSWPWKISAAGSHPNGSCGWLWPFEEKSSQCLSPATGNETNSQKGIRVINLWSYFCFYHINNRGQGQVLIWADQYILCKPTSLTWDLVLKWVTSWSTGCFDIQLVLHDTLT